MTASTVTGQEHWTTKKTADGDVRLFLWEKYVGSPEGKPAVLFVHGSSMASTPTFDLKVPGRPHSSVMDWFAERGF
ncbi:MAG: alpha/beta hydrolase, partial [Burkholderiaceae bacterium]